MVTLDSLVDMLAEDATIEASEKITLAMQKRYLIEAVKRHNPGYSLSETESTVPDREANVVVTLAWAHVQNVRASRMARTAGSSNSPGGYNADRSTPFAQSLKMHASLLEDYKTQCAALGLKVHAFMAVSSTVVVEDPRSGVTFPVGVTVPLLPVTLMSAPFGAGTVELYWELPEMRSPRFLKHVLYVATGSVSIKDPANSDSTPYPYIREGIEPIWETSRFDDSAVKLSIDSTVGTTYRFLMGTVSVDGKIVFSSELVAVQT